MWAKAALLSILTAASAFAAPAERVPARVSAAFQPNYLLPAQDQRGQRNLRPLREIVAELQAQYGGRYLGHQVVERGGRVIYVIEWLMADGVTRRTFPVDAGSAG